MASKKGSPIRKGHNFERLVAKMLKSGLSHNVQTTRLSSRKLDNCGIDLVNTDALYQCKAGYDTRRPRYEEIYDYVKSNLEKEFDDSHIIHKYPILLVHNIDVGSGHKRSPKHMTVTMTMDDYINMRQGIFLPILQVL